MAGTYGYYPSLLQCLYAPDEMTTEYSWVESAPMQGNELRASLNYNPNIENVLADYQPTGTEYAEYLKAKKQ